MSLREAAQQALEALEGADEIDCDMRDAINALRTALTVPGNDYERGFVDGMSHQAKSSVDRAVNAMARKPLTDEEIDALPWTKNYESDVTLYEALRDFARAIERAHGIGGEA